MPFKQWNPATKISRGNIAVGIAPVIADINAPKLNDNCEKVASNLQSIVSLQGERPYWF